MCRRFIHTTLDLRDGLIYRKVICHCRMYNRKVCDGEEDFFFYELSLFHKGNRNFVDYHCEVTLNVSVCIKRGIRVNG